MDNINKKRRLCSDADSVRTRSRKRIANIEDCNGDTLRRDNIDFCSNSRMRSQKNHVRDSTSIQPISLLQSPGLWINDGLTCGHEKGFRNDETAGYLVALINETSTSALEISYQGRNYQTGMVVPFTVRAPQMNSCHGELHAASIMYNVGLYYGRMKNLTEARKWLELAASRVKENSSSEAASMLLVKILHDMGFFSYRLGEFDKAMTCFEKSLVQVKNSKLGDQYLAATKNAMAVVLFHMKPSNPTVVLHLFQESFEAYLKMYGGMSKEVATTLNNIGRIRYLSGEYHTALQSYESALRIRRCLYERDSVDLAVTICNLGQTYHQLKDFDKAMILYEEFLQIAKNRVEYSNRDISIIVKCIANIRHERGQLEEAKNMYKKALEIGKLAFGSIHPELASIINKLGKVHYEMHDLDSALKYYQEGLEMERLVYGLLNPNVLVTLMNIAQIHRDLGSFACAFLTYSQVHSLQIKVDGPLTLAAANTLFSMGLMLYHMRAYASALAFHKEALSIQRHHFDSDENADIAATLNSIGIVLFHLGRYESAGVHFSESLQIRRKLYGNEHRDVAINLYNLATLHLEMGDDELAITLYKETLRIERKTNGDNQDVTQTLQHLGLVYQQRGELGESLVYFGEALEIERNKKGKNHIFVGKLLNLIGNIHLQRADVAEMMACYIEASRIYAKHNETLVIAGYNFFGLSKLHPECAEAA